MSIYIPEKKFNFELLDSEIAEARLYRTTRNLNDIDGRDAANLLYLNTLSLYMMHKDDKQYDYSRSYAGQTIKYGNYKMFKSHSTDLYLLANIVSNPDVKTFRLKNNMDSKRFLRKLKFEDRKHFFFIRNISTDKVQDKLASPYLFRLESQLKIKDGRYKQWRRLIMDWENLRFTQRQLVTAKCLQEIRRIAKGSELVAKLSTMSKYRGFKVTPKYDKPSLGKRVAGTAAGAIAGRVIGKKIGKKFGKNVDKYKKVGTGIGAIAGYWASGRQRQT